MAARAAALISVGIDLGGTNVKCCVLQGVGDGAEVLTEVSRPNRTHDGEDQLLAGLADLAEEVAAPYGRPARVGLGLPGHFDAATGTGTLLPNLPGDWVGRPIAAPLEAALGVPVHLVNDARAFTLAEVRRGAGRGAADLLFVVLGTGVGGGVVLGGRLHLGLGHAGEIGHTTVDPDGPLCGCGNRGCLDRMAGAAQICTDAGQPTVEAVVAAASVGDVAARRALELAGERVGRVLAGAVVLLWPERIVVGGGVAQAGEWVLGPLRQELARRACVAPVGRIEVRTAELGVYAGAVGAALFAAEAA